jgi:AcrR family transcriptional regulator
MYPNMCEVYLSREVAFLAIVATRRRHTIDMTHLTSVPIRRRNPRGQGEQLREDLLDAADTLLAMTGEPGLLSLRRVAKQVGIAAPSVYLHFPDITDLKIAVVQRAFLRLDAARDRASQAIGDPVASLLARLQAYAQFALENPGRYRLMFGPELPATLAYDEEHSPGRRALQSLARSIRRCQEAGSVPHGDDPQHVAVLVWTALHGIVLLRLDRPHFPWPPLEEMVMDMVLRLARCDVPQEGHQAPKWE